MGDHSPRTGRQLPFAKGRFLLSHRLGGGSFGDIYQGIDTHSNTIVAVKLEKRRCQFPQLEYEGRVYRLLHQKSSHHSLNSDGKKYPTKVSQWIPSSESPSSTNNNNNNNNNKPKIIVGIPQIYYYGSEGDFNVLVMEFCGPCLEDLFNYCHRKFSLKTVLMIAEQMLYRIEYVHAQRIIHRDIKPENFVFGIGRKSHVLYIIDFGLSKLYWDFRKNEHIPFKDGKSLTGTARYCSSYTHKGYEQSRRDDLESISYLFIYFLKGSLPWQGVQAKDQDGKTVKIGEKKIEISFEDLCKGIPDAFYKFATYSRELSFTESPDYNRIRSWFHQLAKEHDYLKCPRVIAASPNGSKCSSDASPRKDHHHHHDNKNNNKNNNNNNNNKNKNNNNDNNNNKSLDSQKSLDKLTYNWMFDWYNKRYVEVRKSNNKAKKVKNTVDSKA